MSSTQLQAAPDPVLLSAAVHAVQAMAATDLTMDEYWQQERIAVTVVRVALENGWTARHVATRSGLPGLTIIRLITDPTARTAALVAEKHHAARYVEAVREATVDLALTLHRGGMTKGAVTDALGISRPTLDRWIADEASEDVLAAPPQQ